MKRLPVRWRLTLWFAAVVGLILVAAGVGLGVVLKQWLYAELDEDLRTQSAVARAAVRIDGERLAVSVGMEDADAEEYFLRLIDADGAIVYDNGAALGGVPLRPEAIDEARAGRESLASLTVDEGEAVRVATGPVRASTGDVVGVLQVGLDRHDVDETVADLAGAMLLVAPLALAAAAAGGYALAGWALRPVAEITRLAAAIDDRALDARLGLDLPDDELGRLARAFDAMLARIEDAFGRQRQFTGDAAHELRTPLGLLRSRIDVTLARHRHGADYREALLEARQDVERLTAVVAGLLTLARSDAGAFPVESVPLDLGEVASDVLDQFVDAAAARQVALVNVTVPTPARADPDLVVQLLVNLIDNALRYTPLGGSVTVGAAPVEAGCSVRLWVTDTGVGIPPEHQRRIFDRFFRIDGGRARSDGGAGLGLPICRVIAEAHGGTIGVESRPGAGSTFTVVLSTGLPRSARSSPTESTNRSAAPAASRALADAAP